MTIASGVLLGDRYKILSLVGAGGMGEVYRGKDLRLGREVAIKALPEHFAADPRALARFEREAKALAALSHPNILAIHDFFTDHGVSFAVMELLQGETLRARLKASALTWQRVVEIGTFIAEGLSAAHSRGVIHRDLKPENIFLTSDGTVKILDFGLARWEPTLAEGELRENPTLSIQTELGQVMGTLPYMSPEQVRGGQVDARGDIFSFGCVLYEMITSRSPFFRGTTADTISAILNENPGNLATAKVMVPSGLDHVISRCLEKAPEKRFQSARDLAFALREISSNAPASRPTQARVIQAAHYGSRFRMIALLIAFVVLLLAGMVSYRFIIPAKAIDSLAVLPFQNVGADPNMEYLSDGLTEALIDNLSQFPSLKVMSHNSVFRFKGKEVDARTVANELHVKAVLTGRVTHYGENLIISTELVDAKDDSHLWGQQYNQKLADLLSVQQQISREIVDQLRMKLTGEQQSRLSKQYTQNGEAYQLYLKGLYQLNRRSQEGLSNAIDYFQQAIQNDPNFALAYALLGQAYTEGSRNWRDTLPKANAALLKALELDGSLAEPHISLARISYVHDWDWSTAEKEFKRSIQLNPALVEAHHSYSHLLLILGRTQESLAESKRALELDPLDPGMNMHMQWYYVNTRQYDLAIQQASKTLHLDPNYYNGHFFLGITYMQKGMYNQSILELQKARSISPNPEVTAELGYLFSISGKKPQAEQLLQGLLKGQNAMLPAIVYSGLGEKDRVFEWLEKAFRDREAGMLELVFDFHFDKLRSDPRFVDLLHRMNLPSY